MEELLDKKIKIDKSDWQLVTFGDVVIEPKESTKDPIGDEIEHIVGLEHITSEDVHLRNYNSIKESTTFTKKFDVDDVLFGRRRAYLKKAAQAKFSGICSGDITVFRAKDKLLPELLPFIVQNDKFFDYAIKHSAGGLSPRVKFKDLANYEFHLPSKKRQEELSHLFTSLDNLIEDDSKTLDKLNKYKNAIFENILAGMYNCSVLNQDEWTLTKMESFLSIPSKIKASIIDKTKILSVRLHLKGVVKNKSVDGLKLGATTYYIREAGQFIYGKQNLFNGALGIVPEELDGFLSSSDIPALNINTDKILPEFLMLYLSREKFYKYLEKHSSGSGSKRIGEKILLNIEINLPSRMQQEKIIDLIRDKEKLIKTCESKISSSKSLQKSLINQVF
jgi:type I restriction enzyme S subunit